MNNLSTWTSTQIINYTCAVDCIVILIDFCNRQINEEKALCSPSLAKIDVLLTIQRELEGESRKLRVGDYARIAFIRNTFDSRKKAYGNFRVEEMRAIQKAKDRPNL